MSESPSTQATIRHSASRQMPCTKCHVPGQLSAAPNGCAHVLMWPLLIMSAVWTAAEFLPSFLTSIRPNVNRRNVQIGLLWSLCIARGSVRVVVSISPSLLFLVPAHSRSGRCICSVNRSSVCRCISAFAGQLSFAPTRRAAILATDPAAVWAWAESKDQATWATVVLSTKPKRIAHMASSNTRYQYLYHLVPVGAFPGADAKPYFPSTYQQVRRPLQCTSNANERMPRPVAHAQHQVSGATLSTSACRTASFTSQRILSSY